MPVDNYDPYNGQKRTGGPAMNGKRGSLTPASAANADSYATTKGDPYAAFGAAGNAWSKALGPRGISEASVPSISQPRQAAGVGSATRQPAGIGAAGRQPTGFGNSGGDLRSATAPPLRSYGAPMVTYGGPNGTSTNRPGASAPGINPMWRPVGGEIPQELRSGDGSLAGVGALPGATSRWQPMDAGWMNEPGPGNMWSPYGDTRTYRSGPNGEVYDTAGFGPRSPQGVGSAWQPMGAPPINEPGGVNWRSYDEIPQELRVRQQKPGLNTAPSNGGMWQPVGGGFATNQGFSPDGGLGDDFRPGWPVRGGGAQPTPQGPSPGPRPPATPSTQPPPGGARPPATPSTQPPPNSFTPSGAPPMITFGGPGGTTTSRPPTYGPSGAPPMVTFGVPGGTTTAPPGSQFREYGAPMVTYGGPNGTTTRNPGASTSPFGPEFDANGKLLSNPSVGVRWKDRSPGVPDEFVGAGGYPVQNWIQVNGPNGMQTVLADYNGNPIIQNGSMVTQGPGGAPVTAPATGTGAPTSGGTTGTSTSTGSGQFSAPNNQTTFDPNTLPASNVGDWFDPIMNNALEQQRREAMHAGSLTGATNSGGFIPGLTQELGNTAMKFAGMKGELQFEDQNRKADRLLDKYKFDNTQQLQGWIEQNRQELERYGIDTNALVSRYQSDQSLKAAGIGADASRFAARTGADASRYNAMLGYMQGMAGIGANYGLGQDRLGFDYYNANQNYDLGRGQLGYNYWNSGQQRAYDDMFNQRGYDLGVYGINRDVYGMDQAQQRYLMDLMWRMSPGGQMGGGYFPTPGMFPYGG